MKQTLLKKLIKEAVKEAIQEELKDIPLEAVRSPKQQVVENIQPQKVVKGPAMSSNEKREPYQNILGDMQTSFGTQDIVCLLYTSPSPRDRQKSRMPSSA